ncbi:hypothetical protein BGX33_011984 [Mortierella sp. NVP41]|nr:hypothetical protein BGX33_011984 [Mortierella sp. NVP41]
MPPLILIILAPILVAALIFGGTILFAPKSSLKDKFPSIAITTITTTTSLVSSKIIFTTRLRPKLGTMTPLSPSITTKSSLVFVNTIRVVDPTISVAATTAAPKYPSDEAAVMMTTVPPAMIITDTQIPKVSSTTCEVPDAATTTEAVPSAGISLSPIPKDDDKKDREKTDDEGEDDDDIEWEDDEQEDDVDKKPKVNETSSTQSSHSKDSRHVVNAIQLEEGQMPKKIPMKTWKFFKSRRSVASKKD